MSRIVELHLGAADCPACGAMLDAYANSAGKSRDGKIILREQRCRGCRQRIGECVCAETGRDA